MAPAAPALRSRTIAGFTLVEAMIVLAIVAILVAGAAPSFARLVAAQRATTAVNDLVRGMHVARNEALRRGRRVYIAPVGARWQDGWAVFVDRDDDRSFDPSIDELVFLGSPPGAVRITHPTNPLREPFTDVGSPQRTYVSFDGGGYPRQRNGAYNIGSLVVTARAGDAQSLRTLCLASFGRIRVVIERATC